MKNLFDKGLEILAVAGIFMLLLAGMVLGSCNAHHSGNPPHVGQDTTIADGFPLGLPNKFVNYSGKILENNSITRVVLSRMESEIYRPNDTVLVDLNTHRIVEEFVQDTLKPLKLVRLIFRPK